MTDEEIRKEIAERKKHARDLKVRELLWELCYYGLSQYPEYLAKDPEMILPEIKDSFSAENSHFKFLYDGAKYEIVYKEGMREKDSWGSRNWEDEIETTPVTITLKIDDECVFQFEMERTVQHTREMPLFNEHMGDVQAYIPGPWATSVAEVKRKIDDHKKSVREKRSAPKRAQQLKEEMKRFGL